MGHPARFRETYFTRPTWNRSGPSPITGLDYSELQQSSLTVRDRYVLVPQHKNTWVDCSEETSGQMPPLPSKSHTQWEQKRSGIIMYQPKERPTLSALFDPDTHVASCCPSSVASTPSLPICHCPSLFFTLVHSILSLPLNSGGGQAGRPASDVMINPLSFLKPLNTHVTEARVSGRWWSLWMVDVRRKYCAC